MSRGSTTSRLVEKGTEHPVAAGLCWGALCVALAQGVQKEPSRLAALASNEALEQLLAGVRGPTEGRSGAPRARLTRAVPPV